MTVEVDEDTARKVFRLIDALEDNDDVQNVYANFDVSDACAEPLDSLTHDVSCAEFASASLALASEHLFGTAEGSTACACSESTPG